MANVFATKAGNWSDPTVWNTGALPTSADDVFSNNFAVVINQNITVLSIRTEAASGINAGGSFTVSSSGLTLACQIRPGTTAGLTVSTTGTLNLAGDIIGSASAVAAVSITGIGCTVNYIGNATSGTGSSNAITSSIACNINITGTLNGNSGGGVGCNITGIGAVITINGTINGGSGTNSAGFAMTGNSVVNITGNCFGGTGNGCNAVLNSSAGGTITVNGNVTGGSFSNAFGIANQGNGTCIVNGNAIGGIAAAGASNTAGGTMRVNVATANSLSVGVVGLAGSLSSGVTIVKSIVFGPNGQVPVSGFVRFDNANTITTQVRRENGTDITLTDATNLANELPAPANVRAGTVYNSGNRTGTLAVPDPANVRKGIATDNTLGTADLTADDIWSTSIASLTEGIGARLKNVSTVETTGDQLAGLL